MENHYRIADRFDQAWETAYYENKETIKAARQDFKEKGDAMKTSRPIGLIGPPGKPQDYTWDEWEALTKKWRQIGNRLRDEGHLTNDPEGNSVWAFMNFMAEQHELYNPKEKS